ncbi:MAG: thiamine-phosphate kinase [Acidimicrobiales bacterium]|jgi:thiamine-monophosphate kinase
MSRLVEDETLERIRHALGGGIEAGGLRDDAAAVVVPDGGPVVVSVDSVVDGVHVDLALCSPHDVGWKALMGALSDLAAMGARPIGALVALCVPEAAGGGEMTLGVMEGVAEASQVSGCPVVGGDVSAAGVLVVSVTVMGTLDGGTPVPRSGAAAGDVILVTGPCGGSAAGLRVLRSGAEVAGLDPVEVALAAAYRRPVARLAEGEAARRAGASAMIDVSDGLALDLHRLADASGVGFILDSVPVAEGATPDDALGGGEDYELVVVIGAGLADSCARSWAGAGLRPLHRIGVVTADPTQRTLWGRDLARLGWQHRLG